MYDSKARRFSLAEAQEQLGAGGSINAPVRKGKASLRLSRWVLLMLSMVSLVGSSCDTSRSENRPTREISADFLAIASSSGKTRLRGDLQTTFFSLKLTGGDRLVGTVTDPEDAETQARKMKVHKRPDGVRYRRDFSGAAKDTLIEIDFDRSESGQTSAFGSFATLPAPFRLNWVSSLVTREPAALDFSRNGAETRFLVWDPVGAPDFEAGDVLTYFVEGDCIEPYSGSIDWEAGEEALLLTGVLLDRAAPNDGQTCPIKVEMRLTREGVLDPLFRSGGFFAEQRRELTLLARP